MPTGNYGVTPFVALGPKHVNENAVINDSCEYEDKAENQPLLSPNTGFSRFKCETSVFTLTAPDVLSNVCFLEAATPGLTHTGRHDCG
jgi:hypothetical protein